MSSWNRPNCPEHNSWRNMWDRCHNPKCKCYDRYGGRGVTVCERWRDFFLFVEDMGRRPGDGYSLDRIDNEKGYDRDNCRWATAEQQVWNRRNVVLYDWHGEKLPAAVIARKEGVDRNTLKRRLDIGLSIEEAVETGTNYMAKLGRNRMLTLDGVTMSLANWCRFHQASPKLIWQRVNRDGLTWEEALAKSIPT